MKIIGIKDTKAMLTIILAFIFWIFTFRLKVLNFWLSMSMATTILGILSIFAGGLPFTKQDFTLRAVLIGVGSGLLLYGVFWLGNLLSQLLFDFAASQIAAIYNIRGEGAAIMIFFILLLVTSPGEEIFWRGFVQGWAMERYGELQGFILSSALYAAVHLASGNFMLVMAALVAGFFWGYLYWKERNMIALIISHAFWTIGIFVLFPIL